MADRYAPAVFLDVLVFWFVLRWFLPWRLILRLGRGLVLLMVVGAIAMAGEGRILWSICFAGSAALAWALLRRWHGRPVLQPFTGGASRKIAWRGKSAGHLAALCERRIGELVQAAAPATVAGTPPSHCVLALAANGLWVLEDESRWLQPRVGRVLACWDRAGLVPHIEHTRRAERFELSWPRHGALVRGAMAPGEATDRVVGYLVADELLLR